MQNYELQNSGDDNTMIVWSSRKARNSLWVNILFDTSENDLSKVDFFDDIDELVMGKVSAIIGSVRSRAGELWRENRADSRARCPQDLRLGEHQSIPAHRGEED